MRIGKLDNDLLKKIILDKIEIRRPEVLKRPEIGEDCAAIDFGDAVCVLSTDPITAAVSKIGSLAVHVSCNDIASDGIEPLGLLLTVLLPPDVTESDIENLIAQAAAAAGEIGVEIIGGHTEITDTVKQPVIVTTAIGKGLKSEFEAKETARSGDIILVTKQLAMEGTGILATDHVGKLKGFSAAELAEAEAMLAGISVVKEGVLAGRIGTTAMHDITEGGIFGAIYEICELSGLGAEIDERSLPVAPITKKICSFFEIDPYKLISSGSMLIAARPDKAEEIQKALAQEEIESTAIGILKDKKDGVKLRSVSGILVDIDPPGSDDIYKLNE